NNRRTVWLLIFLVLTVMFLSNYARFITSSLAEGRPAKYIENLICEATGIYTVLLLIPLVVWFVKKFPITRQNIFTHLPLHILGSMVYGTIHTLLMYWSRTFIFWMLNLGTYDYGRIMYRFLMEYSHQFFTYWIIYITVLFFRYVKQTQEQKLKTVQLQEQLTKVRLEALQMQLHPHFLFNTLNMISSTMYEDPKAADRMIANLSDLLRITLDSKGGEEHTLEKELEILDIYLKIMKARYKNKLTIDTHIAENTLKALVPGFILQPLVENSIKFSMENLQSTEIDIISRKEDSTLKLIIRDNGPGILGNPDIVIKNGVGLSNTAERLEKLYGDDHRFNLQNLDERGLQVEIQIPFQSSTVEE
ncbi:MAG: histidine kinase, partial [bacterium]